MVESGPGQPPTSIEDLRLGPEPRFGLIGGSGVQVDGKEQHRVTTPFGDCLVSFMDDSRRVLFANRHLCTPGKAYSPPHEVNFQALIWALVVECGCSGGVVAIGSTGTLDPEAIPVGSVVMPDDYAMVRPDAITFWGHPGIGIFAGPAKEEGGLGRIHYSPADPCDERWIKLRGRVQQRLAPLLGKLSDGQVKLGGGQTPEIWPFRFGGPRPGLLVDGSDATVYVNTIGPRFETRAEIRSYRALGHVVGMTCGSEWALCEELQTPYCLVCFCDNACNGLSAHPNGALQEYLDHKKCIAETSGAVVREIVAELSDM